ncbi:MAG: hypothetical protein A2Z99_03160 [Treponema sp. GWB1_62_6]|nr:MAG: hypothetical protein A2001_14020 [Treponema sp. GWC1_61_84]OHE67811.1 MAG: hypothetical protein A2Z99_03160 [Treponema sp. GWB1_62_6]OHE75310.1 MAG: hypothetical protein A2413_08655 [Treponema sp. RIFOXYC1_FULL_61_9]HCM25701.1 hypothetical protein [Treponema sp.]
MNGIARSRRRGGYLLSNVARAMGRKFEALMKDAGLGDIGSGEGRLVYLLWRDGPMRQGELAAKAGIDKSTLALTLARMERKDLVERRQDDDDGRAVIVSVSASAALRAPSFDLVSNEMNEFFYAGLAEGEIDAFEATLKKILLNFRNEGSA